MHAGPTITCNGPDHRRVPHRHLHSRRTTRASGGDAVATVFVVVRNAPTPSQILARSASTFSSINIANVNGKAIVKLSFSAPKADITNTPITASQISATLSNGQAETGTLSFFVLPAPAAPSLPCTGASWQALGAVTVNGDGVYHPTAGYTPTVAGTYYWYATYSGDPNNKKASSICGASMARMTVQASKWSPTLSVSTTASTGIVNTAIPASSITATVASSSGHDDGGDHVHGLRPVGERSRRLHDDGRRSVDADRHDHAERRRLVQPERGLHAGLGRNLLVLRELPGRHDEQRRAERLQRGDGEDGRVVPA